MELHRRTAQPRQFVEAHPVKGGVEQPRQLRLMHGQPLGGQYQMAPQRLHVVGQRFESPRLRLVPQRNRLATTLDVMAIERVFGSAAKGVVDLEYGLRYEAADATVRLRDVRVESMKFDRTQGGLDPTPFVSRSMAEQLLENLAFAKLAQQRVDELRAQGLERATLTVTESGLDVIFTAAAAR